MFHSFSSRHRGKHYADFGVVILRIFLLIDIYASLNMFFNMGPITI